MPDYTLMDGELSHALYPDTFEIDDRNTRESLAVGDFAKVGFEYHDFDDDEEHIGGERMWVKITDAAPLGWGVVYIGTLNNEPLEDVLKFGQEVTFLPQHVLSFMREEE